MRAIEKSIDNKAKEFSKKFVKEFDLEHLDKMQIIDLHEEFKQLYRTSYYQHCSKIEVFERLMDCCKRFKILTI